MEYRQLGHSGLKVSAVSLGQAVRGRRRKVLLATKARFATADGPNDAGASRHHLIEACYASLERLETDYLDLFRLHEWDGVTSLDETLSTLDALVRSGHGATAADRLSRADLLLLGPHLRDAAARWQPPKPGARDREPSS